MQKSLISIFIFVLMTGFSATNIFALRPDPADSREVAVYMRGASEIHEERTVEIIKGEGEALLPMISGSIIANSITLDILKGKDIETLAIAYAYGLVDDENLWEKRIGEMVELDVGDSLVSGVLRRYVNSKLFIEPDPENEPGKIIVIDEGDVAEPVLEGLPGKLVFEPSIRWTYRAKKTGKVKVRLRYMTNDISWTATYRAELDEGSVSLEGITTIDNLTGMDLPYDNLILVAGDIHLAGDRRRVDRMNPKPGAGISMTETQFGDIRRWKIDQPGKLYSGHETILPLVEAKNVKFSKRYVYDATIFNDRITAHLDIQLSGSDAMPLPAGVVRIYQKGDGGELLFTGEDKIDDTPAGSPLDLTIAQAFDLSAERVRDLEEPMPDGGTKQGYHITLGNSGNSDITIEVLERMFGAWTIESATVNGNPIKHEIKDARTGRFNVSVPTGAIVRLEYEIVYTRSRN
ncbi:MAG: hypothetical protein P9L92_16915 [Candidatus Electryonea clarkiae]|nr:hypothetical protein [Candidatus Electryonea clarkiae]MDP8289238.1 hypothetical protein [Candidatus Electryonea clarkiae]